VCDAGYSGSDCSQKPIDINVIPGNDNSSQIVIIPSNSSSNFTISLLGLQEINATGWVVKNYSYIPFTQTYSYDASAGIKMYNYTSVLAGNPFNLSLYYWTFTQTTNISYLNEPYSVPANTLKFSIYVGSYTFASVLNSLAITIFQTTTAAPVQGACNSAPTQGGGESMGWYTISTGNTTLYATVNQYALVDGSKVHVEYTFDPSLQTTVIKVPYFWEGAYIDPDYAVLLSTDSNACSASNGYSGILKMWYFWLGIGVIVVLLVILVVVVVPRTWRYIHLKYVEKQLASNNSTFLALRKDSCSVEMDSMFS